MKSLKENIKFAATSPRAKRLKRRSLAVHDGPEVHALLEKAYDGTYGYPIGGMWSLESVVSEIEKGCGWALFRGNGLLAFVLLREIGLVWDTTFLATDPNFQGQGYMRDLFGFVLQQVPSGGAVWLEVHEGNLPAHRLYRRLGFRRVGMRPQYYRDGGAAILFEWVARK